MLTNALPDDDDSESEPEDDESDSDDEGPSEEEADRYGDSGGAGIGSKAESSTQRFPIGLRPRSLTIGGEEKRPRKLFQELLKYPEFIRSVRELRLLNPWPSLQRWVSWFLEETRDVMPLERVELLSFAVLSFDGG